MRFQIFHHLYHFCLHLSVILYALFFDMSISHVYFTILWHIFSTIFLLNLMSYFKQTPANLKRYYATCFGVIVGIIIFGGLLAPSVCSLWYFYAMHFLPDIIIVSYYIILHCIALHCISGCFKINGGNILQMMIYIFRFFCLWFIASTVLKDPPHYN